MNITLSRGLATSIPERYLDYSLFNLKRIYSELGCSLPIEIWEVGNELSNSSKDKINSITDQIIWRNVSEISSNLDHWKGFQVKGLIVANSSFNELIFFDADGIFHQEPSTLFDQEGYKKTGLYLFRDLERWVFKFNWFDRLVYRLNLRNAFKGNKFHNCAFFLERQAWLRRCLNHQKPEAFPMEWSYIWKDEIPKDPVIETFVDSGILAINRSRHPIMLRYLYELNDNHPETYKYIWGDKETFWISALMANETFSVHSEWAYERPANNSKGWKEKNTLICQSLNQKLFFTQKGLI